VGWIPLLAEVVPEIKRASVFAARNIFANVTNSGATLLFGIWLGLVDFPVNFSIMYITGWVMSMISCYYIWKMDIPDSPTADPALHHSRSFQQRIKSLYTSFQTHKPFTQIIINTFLHGFGLWAASPLYVLRYLRELNASDSWIGYLGTITSVSAIVGMTFWRWFMPKIGEKTTLKITILMVGIYPILVGILPVLTPIFFAAILNGIVSAGVNLILLKTTPEKNRPEYTAIYITFMNIGAFLFPLIGVSISELVGLSTTLISCGILSIFGSSSFIWMPVKTKDTHNKPQN
jgi:MFS family permease